MAETVVQEMMSTTSTDTSEVEGKYLTFWTDKQLFGIPIADVVQIVQIQDITQIPEFPHYAKGIINLRGSIIPVIDIRLRIGKDEIPYDDHTCIIIIYVDKRVVGFIVDAVEEVTPIDEEEITAPPRLSGGVSGDYLTGIGRHGGRVILLLDTHKMLGDDVFSGF